MKVRYLAQREHTMTSEVGVLMVDLLRRYSNTPILPKLDTPDRGPVSAKQPTRIHRIDRRLATEILEQLITDYLAGIPTTQLTTRYGIGKGAVLRLLEARGVLHHQNRLTPEQCAEVIRLYQSGLSLAAVGTQVGRDPSLIRLVLQRAGVPRRDTRGR